MRLPAQFSLYLVPAVCLLLLGAAWFLLRGGGRPDETGPPVLRLLCDQELQSPITGIVAAFQRRGVVKVEVDYVSSSELADRLAGETVYDLLLLSAEDPIEGEWIGEGLVVESESGTEPGVLRSFLVKHGPSPDLASDFVEFLSGPFAVGVLGQLRAAGRTPGL